MSFFDWLFGRTTGIVPTDLSHYEQVKRSAGGKPCELTLVHAAGAGQVAELVYCWKEDLSHEEADRVDSRARAYVSCALCDVARAAGLRCKPGPRHGQRPSVVIAGSAAPYSLVYGAFSADEKAVTLHIGPVMRSIEMSEDSDTVASDLARAFSKHLRQIRV